MADESEIHRDIRGQSHVHPDLRAAALAGRQHGRVARSQLLALGLSTDAIDRRVVAGRLHPVHRGVYAVGHLATTPRARWMAAVLACGPGAVLSHRSAAALWGLRNATAIEVTCARQRAPTGVLTHRGVVRPDEHAVLDSIPTTTVARTLLDLATVLPKQDVEAALHQAEYQQRYDHTSLDALLARYPRRRGIAALRALLEELGEGLNITRSDLEIAFMAFLDRHALPRPRRNVLVEGYECDCVWLDERVIVELDSRGHMATRNFESDRVRDFKLTLSGWRAVRITWRRVHRDGPALARDLRYLLRTSTARTIRGTAPRR